MSKALEKLIRIDELREFKNKLVGPDSDYVQTGAVDQTVGGTKTFSKPIAGSVTGSSGSCTGNAASATKLQTARTVNGTSFNGTANITTANWGTARNISITDGTNTSTAVSVNGSANVSLKLPATIKANLTGNCSGTAGGVAWANVSGKPSTFTPSSHNHDSVYVKLTAFPAGVIIPFAGKSVPTGYLLCNGAAVSRTNYANLFAAIGTLYGAGDGSTTFNLPDARDRVLQGASGTHSAGSYIAAGLPNITGHAESAPVAIFNSNPASYSGALFTGDYFQRYASMVDGNDKNLSIFIDASRSSSIYGNSSTVQQSAIATNFIIKY